jgi:hypothetical protein
VVLAIKEKKCVLCSLNEHQDYRGTEDSIWKYFRSNCVPPLLILLIPRSFQLFFIVSSSADVHRWLVPTWSRPGCESSVTEKLHTSVLLSFRIPGIEQPQHNKWQENDVVHFPSNSCPRWQYPTYRTGFRMTSFSESMTNIIIILPTVFHIRVGKFLGLSRCELCCEKLVAEEQGQFASSGVGERPIFKAVTKQRK